MLSRIDLIGQNGNDGEHYDVTENKPAFTGAECEALLAKPTGAPIPIDDDEYYNENKPVLSNEEFDHLLGLPISQHEPGAKMDQDKNRLGLVLNDFAAALEQVSEVGTMGAKKYSDHGWLAVPNAQERYEDALLRHHFKAATGETLDPESGLLHLAHRAWNALATLEFEIKKRLNNE